MKKFFMVVVASLIAIVSVNAETTNVEVHRSFHNLGISTKVGNDWNCDWKDLHTEIVFMETLMSLENEKEISTYIFSGKSDTKTKIRGNNIYKMTDYKVVPTCDILNNKITAQKVTRIVVYSKENTYLREWYEITEKDGTRYIYK